MSNMLTELDGLDKVIDSLKECASPNLFHEQAALVSRATALLARLKAFNRAVNAATKTSKDATAAARLEMDQSHLGLQNLQYEKRHLEREIEKCRQFASIYQDVPLYTEEEFILLAPESSRLPEILADEHQLMLNRLNFELAERQRLEQRKKQLVQTKEELLKDGKAKATALENIKVQIELLMKTATDVQKKVDDLVQPLADVDLKAEAKVSILDASVTR